MSFFLSILDHFQVFKIVIYRQQNEWEAGSIFFPPPRRIEILKNISKGTGELLKAMIYNAQTFGAYRWNFNILILTFNLILNVCRAIQTLNFNYCYFYTNSLFLH